MDNECAREMIAELVRQNELLTRRNEMLAESIAEQKKGNAAYEEHNRTALQALDTHRELQELQQLFAQALELWSCDGNVLPRQFRQLKEVLPDPVWDNKKSPSEMVVEEVLEERRRQVEDEGWTPSRDDRVHDSGQLARAAACYAASAGGIVDVFWANKEKWSTVWPWAESYDKRGKHGVRRMLVIAAALCVAEIERLDRKNGATK